MKLFKLFKKNKMHKGFTDNNVNILKNTVIPDDSIVGLVAVASGDFAKNGTGDTGYIYPNTNSLYIKAVA